MKCEKRLTDDKAVEYFNPNFSSNGKPDIHKNEKKEEKKESASQMISSNKNQAISKLKFTYPNQKTLLISLSGGILNCHSFPHFERMPEMIMMTSVVDFEAYGRKTSKLVVMIANRVMRILEYKTTGYKPLTNIPLNREINKD